MKMKSKDIAVSAVAVALMFALAWMPVAAFLIPALFVACLYRWKQGLIVGVFAGLVCLTYSLIIMAVRDGFPDVAGILITCAVMIIPRALVGLFASLTYGWAKKLKGNGKFMRYLPYILACCAGVFTNTVLVVLSFKFLNPAMTIMGFAIGEFWWVFMLIGVAEMLVASLLIPPLCISVGRALRLGEFAPRPATQTETINDVSGIEPAEQSELERIE